MNFAALLGCFSGRATPSLRRNPKAHHTNQTRQESTYLLCEVVQTNEATSQRLIVSNCGPRANRRLRVSRGSTAVARRLAP